MHNHLAARWRHVRESVYIYSLCVWQLQSVNTGVLQRVQQNEYCLMKNLDFFKEMVNSDEIL